MQQRAVPKKRTTTKKAETFSLPRDKLIEQNLSLVQYISSRMAKRLPSYLELDDIYEAGVIGLIDAVDKYNPRKNVRFRTYAEYRIRGAILDSLRSNDWVPRSVRRKSALFDNAFTELSQTKGAPPTLPQVLDYLSLSLKNYYHWSMDMESLTCVSLEDTFFENSKGEKKHIKDAILDEHQEDPAQTLDTKALKKLLALKVKELPGKARHVLYMYYYQDMTMREIGKKLSITESRVSQIHSRALRTLRNHLECLVTS